jgi:acetoin utilization deacetylase AcuC-like enzyme
MTTGFLYDAGHRAHTHPQAPESAARLEDLMANLEEAGELAPCTPLEVEPIPWEWIGAAHTHTHLDAVRILAREGRSRISFDTYLTPSAPQVARLGASSAVCATRAVLEGGVQNAFSLMRPPGHHALSTRAMGYCIFNNIAVAALYALREHSLKRVMILDVDAHHGNGTQEIFYGSRDVLFISLHQHPWFPGTGDWHQNGVDAGEGYSYNVPLPQWSGDEAYLQVLAELVTPLADRYQPELILVSAGFDAHWLDHSSVLGLSVQGTYELFCGFRALAERLCEGRMALVLEGGYNLRSLTACAGAALRALRCAPLRDDPLGPCPDGPVAPVDGVLRHLRGFMEQVAAPGTPTYFDEPAQIPYEIKA